MKAWFIAGLFCASLFISGCSKQPDAPSTPSSGKKVIGVIPKGATHAFWKSIHAGALKAASELDVEILWKSGIKENDRDAQIKVMEDMVIRKVNGIVLAPLDDAALRGPVLEAVKNKIPVVIIDSDLKTDEYVSFVATDNYAGGVKAASHLAFLLGGKGRVVMLRCMEGSASTMNREQGFLDEIKKHSEIKVLSSNQFGGATTEEAYKASENMLAPYRKPDGSLDLDGIFSSNESTTFGMLRALQNSKWTGKVKFVGFDCSAPLVKALENKEMQGLILQDPFQMGYAGVHALVAHLQGQKVEKRIDTGSRLATPENMKNPEIKSLLEPEIKKWLKEE
jgi:ribose transport system substrate-binding protein